MTARPLTPKQVKFCMVYVQTGNASEAYRQSYSAGKMKPSTINRNATALLDNSKIATRIEKLQAEVKETFTITYEQRLEWLQQTIIKGLSEDKASSVTVSAINEINRMTGDHAPVKNDNKNEMSGDVSIEVSFVK